MCRSASICGARCKQLPCSNEVTGQEHVNKHWLGFDRVTLGFGFMSTNDFQKEHCSSCKEGSEQEGHDAQQIPNTVGPHLSNVMNLVISPLHYLRHWRL